MNYYLEVLKEYAVFDGRVRRKKFWMFNLVSFVISLFISFIFPPLSMLYALAVFIPGLAVSVRRLHDTGRSGAWILISLIPLLGQLILLIFLVQDSERGTNQYGPNPKLETSPSQETFNANQQQQQLNSNGTEQNNNFAHTERKQETKIECSDCGAEVNAELNFCPECGSEILLDDKKRCINCDELVAEEARFCPECGTDLELNQ